VRHLGHSFAYPFGSPIGLRIQFDAIEGSYTVSELTGFGMNQYEIVEITKTFIDINVYNNKNTHIHLEELILIKDGCVKRFNINQVFKFYLYDEFKDVNHIGTVNDFYNLDPRGINILDNDIDFKGQPFKLKHSHFTGYLNGCGYTLKNVVLTDEVIYDDYPLALFISSKGSVIENLKISNLLIKPYGNFMYQPRIAAFINEGEYLTVSNCAFEISIEAPFKELHYGAVINKSNRCLISSVTIRYKNIDSTNYIDSSKIINEEYDDKIIDCLVLGK
jgi:hypothetical protein